MKKWNADRVAEAAGAELFGESVGGPSRVTIDSRDIQPGDLFVGIQGENVDGGSFAAGALKAGAWGVVVTTEWVQEARNAGAGVVLVVSSPVAALGSLANTWRGELGAKVIAVTGSVGKTSTKDLIAAFIGPHKAIYASRQNFNTEIGVPLELLAAPEGTEVVVLELAARGFGQIAELTKICDPDVGVITCVAPVHLEQFGSLEGIARVKGEMFETMRTDATAIVPSQESKLKPYFRDVARVVSFGEEGDVQYLDGAVLVNGKQLDVKLPFTQRYQRPNTLAAIAAAIAVGVTPQGEVDVKLSPLRGERITLPSGVVIINDCYNANPLSMRAALDDFASQVTQGRKIAVLGDMLELGPREYEFHRAVGSHANDTPLDFLLTVGHRAQAILDTYVGDSDCVSETAQATEFLRRILQPADTVLIKGSRGLKMEAIVSALASGREGSLSTTAASTDSQP